MLSIIIPTLNEATALPRTVEHTLRSARGARLEVIVSDCGSEDGTADLAEAMGLRVVRGGYCRADALNRGAAVARGEAMLFLHADSLLPQGFPGLIERALAQPAVVGGAFDFQFEQDEPSSAWSATALRLVVMCNRIRFRWTNNYYGDQGIFVRGEVFRRVGGFPMVRLMEDVRFSRRMSQLGRTVIIKPAILTSPRRFLERGVVRQFAQILLLLALESVDVGPARLWEIYNRWNHCNGKGVKGGFEAPGEGGGNEQDIGAVYPGAGNKNGATASVSGGIAL